MTKFFCTKPSVIMLYLHKCYPVSTARFIGRAASLVFLQLRFESNLHSLRSQICKGYFISRIASTSEYGLHFCGSWFAMLFSVAFLVDGASIETLTLTPILSTAIAFCSKNIMTSSKDLNPTPLWKELLSPYYWAVPSKQGINGRHEKDECPMVGCRLNDFIERYKCHVSWMTSEMKPTSLEHVSLCRIILTIVTMNNRYEKIVLCQTWFFRLRSNWSNSGCTGQFISFLNLLVISETFPVSRTAAAKWHTARVPAKNVMSNCMCCV